MDNHVLLQPADDSCINLAQSAEQHCLPIPVRCYRDPKETLLVDCDEVWNCKSNCGGIKNEFYLPVSGAFMLQTLFFDVDSADRTNPDTDFVVVKLVEPDGTESTILNPIPPAAQSYLYNYGWNGQYSYQTFQFDAAFFESLGVDCFQLKFEYNGDECYSQWYRLGENVCENLIGLRVDFEGVDCFYRVYDLGENNFTNAGGPFAYNNRIEIPAKLVYQGEEAELTRFNDVLATKTVTNSVYHIYFEKGIPPFLVKHLGRVHFSGPGIANVNGDDYYFDSVNLLGPSKTTGLFLPNEGIRVYQRCEKSLSC